jgi:dTMP kinase
MSKNGVFITFEGSEGCGKSTQIGRLAVFLRGFGREVITLREPGGTPIGETIRHLLKHDENAGAMTPEAELLLFAASRAQLVRQVIVPALRRGAVLLCDRFLDSTTVYQGLVRAVAPRTVAVINALAIGATGAGGGRETFEEVREPGAKTGVLPDLTLLLDMDAAEGLRRAAGREEPADRMEQEGTEFFEAVRQGYLAIARENAERFAVVDASDTEEGVEISIRKIIKERLHGLF